MAVTNWKWIIMRGEYVKYGNFLARKLYCYDCDSRYDPYCADPFNKTLPPENRPATRVCHGCCVKFVHKFSDGEWTSDVVLCKRHIITLYIVVFYQMLKRYFRLVYCCYKYSEMSTLISRLISFRSAQASSYGKEWFDRTEFVLRYILYK